MTQKNRGVTSTNQNSNVEIGDPISGEARDQISMINANRVGTANTMVSGGVHNNAANETKDAITGRIIHTVNMMKEVLQGNLGLRETI